MADSPFALWAATDVELTQLHAHCGKSLQELGVEISELNLFHMFDCQSIVETPSLVIAACLCPPASYVPYLTELIQKYGHFTPSAADRRSYYEAVAYESMVGQLPRATVLTICRTSDLLRSSNTSSVVGPVWAPPGYRPKQCYLSEDQQLQALAGGGKLTVRGSRGGPLLLDEHFTTQGPFDLVSACYTATVQGMRVVFVGEWDGSLSLSCAMAVLARLHGQACRPTRALALTTPQAECVLATRRMGAQPTAYRYDEFYTYAKDRRLEQCMQLYLERIQRDEGAGDFLYDYVYTQIQPYVYINAGMMWFHATVECPPPQFQGPSASSDGGS